VARVRRQDSDKPLPAFERPLFGGIPTVRGFAVGSAIGDTILATSAELRVPLTSPLKVAQLGLSAFADVGAAYDKGQRLADQVFKRGYGAGAWVSATVFRLNVYVAHGVSASTRVHVETTLLF
jgi:hemolysin activation/secretion protein